MLSGCHIKSRICKVIYVWWAQSQIKYSVSYMGSHPWLRLGEKPKQRHTPKPPSFNTFLINSLGPCSRQWVPAQSGLEKHLRPVDRCMKILCYDRSAHVDVQTHKLTLDFKGKMAMIAEFSRLLRFNAGPLVTIMARQRSQARVAGLLSFRCP